MSDEATALQIAEGEHRAARDEIVAYIEHTSAQRALLAADGHIRQVMSVLSAEMALAGAFGQIDVVRRLGQMAEDLAHAEASLKVREMEDYQRVFGDEIDPLSDSDLRR
jgi:glutathione S-transferase